MQRALISLRPTGKPNVIDLVRQAGFDVSDWGNYQGAPGANPKYCYEWCFSDVSGKRSLVNLWFDSLEEADGIIFVDINMRERSKTEVGLRKARALRFDFAIRNAFRRNSKVDVILLDRKNAETGSATGRKLDSDSWHVAAYCEDTGSGRLVRGMRATSGEASWDPAVQEFTEGEIFIRLSRHRKRESKARLAKIEHALASGNGRLCCEVPGCGFDFVKVYGEVGRGYAHVHHKLPLSALPPNGAKVRLEDLAIVCANCHAIIHRGGGCRNMVDLIS